LLHHITDQCRLLIADEDGLTTVEYALLLALLVVAAIGVWTSFGAKVRASVARAGFCVT